MKRHLAFSTSLAFVIGSAHVAASWPIVAVPPKPAPTPAAQADPDGGVAIAEAPTQSPYNFSYIVDDGGESNMSVVDGNVFVVEHDRVGIVTGDHVDWTRFSRGLKHAMARYQNYGTSGVIGTSLDNLWITLRRYDRTHDDAGYLHFVAKRGWQAVWPDAYGSFVIKDFVMTKTGGIGVWTLSSGGRFDPVRGHQEDRPPGGHFLVGYGTSLPPVEQKGFRVNTVALADSGEFTVTGCLDTKPRAKKKHSDDDDHDSEPDCQRQTRTWMPGGKVVITNNDDDVEEPPREFHRAKDGTSWRVELAHDQRDSDDYPHGDEPFHDGGFIELRAANGTIRNVSPQGVLVKDVVGVESGSPWIITSADTPDLNRLAHWDAAKKTWIDVAIPRPPSASPKTTSEPTIDSIIARDDGSGDVWVAVTFGELAPDPNTPEGKKAA